MQLHERLRELRQERKLRLKDIAEHMNISVPYLSDLERGRTNPSLETLQAMAAAYGISVKDLLTGIEGYGETTESALPSGLSDLLADPVLGANITPDWVRTLSRIELRGRRPRTKQDWLEIYLHLRRILD